MAILTQNMTTLAIEKPWAVILLTAQTTIALNLMSPIGVTAPSYPFTNEVHV